MDMFPFKVNDSIEELNTYVWIDDSPSKHSSLPSRSRNEEKEIEVGSAIFLCEKCEKNRFVVKLFLDVIRHCHTQYVRVKYLLNA